MVYNFALPPLLAYSILKGETTVLTEWARSLELPGDRVCFFNFTASHDGVGLRPVQDILPIEDIRFLFHTAEQHGKRVSYRATGGGSKSPYEINCNYVNLLTHPEESDELRVAHMLLSQAVLLAMPGVPGVYFHSLVGSRNYLDGVEKTGVNRAINREKLELADLENQLRDPEHLRSKIYSGYRNLMRIRTAQPAFQPYGTFEFPETIAGVFAIGRKSQNPLHDILALHNFTGRVRQFPLPVEWPTRAFDLVGNQHVAIIDGLVRLAPYQIPWLIRSP